MKLLFAKQSLAWPRVSGHDVHAYQMMRACAGLGHAISLATVLPPRPEALEALPLASIFALDEPANGSAPLWRTSKLQEKFRSFYGIPQARVGRLAALAREVGADAVVVVGLDGLPYFPALSGVVRIWYAADEWVWHHLSQLKIGDPDFKTNVRDAAIKGLYERAHRRVVDRVWVVSPTEARAMRWLAGMANADVLPNGVDANQFAPGSEVAVPFSAAFWGRLDFGPNTQALAWFVKDVWPSIRQQEPQATLSVIGFHPGDAVKRFAGRDGITLQADVPDLREMVRRHAVAVLPFISGGGIKNKLLEAAALGMPIVSTPTAVGGLRGTPALITAGTAPAFADAVVRLWRNDDERRRLGTSARAWVREHHTWEASARDAMEALAADLERRRRR